MRRQEAFTLIELLLVMALIGIVSAIAIPGLVRARQTGNEASAIGSIRAVGSGQAAYASACAGGGYAQSNSDLSKAPAGGAPFIGPDLAMADVIATAKSGYLIDVSDNADPTNRDVTPSADTCNASTANARLNYFVSGNPVSRGETGSRSFASDRRNTVFFDRNADIDNPIPAGSDFIQ